MSERTFIACPERCIWLPVQASGPEMAYLKVCSDYLPSRPICILDPRNKTYNVYIRKLNKNGNLIKVEEQELFA